MADITQDQQLDFLEFCIAMFLITAKKKGQELPPTLPESLIASIRADAPVPPINSPQPGQPGVGFTPVLVCYLSMSMK